jgi:type II secretory pathway pseudopilin PulG
MTRPTPIRSKRRSEEGFILIAVIFLLFLFALALSIAAPKIAMDIQRQRDLETMERGKQYIRAIQLYYRQFHSYPPSIDALIKTNNMRFLRRRYIDPITGKDDWKPIHFGQNKAPLAMGFFGQALAGGAPVAGTGPSGSNGMPGASPLGGGMGSPMGGGMGGGMGSPAGGSSLFSSTDTGTASGTGTGTETGAETPAGATGSTAAPGGTAGSATTSGSGTGSGTGTGSDTGTGLNGQTFGGGGIIGFKPASPKKSILVYKTKDHYNQWEFVYDPLADMRTMSASGGPGGQPADSMSSPNGDSGFGGQSNGFGGQSNGFGGSNSLGGSTFGGSGGIGSSPSTTTTPTQP